MQAWVVYSETNLPDLAIASRPNANFENVENKSVMRKWAKLARLHDFDLLVHVMQAVSEP